MNQFFVRPYCIALLFLGPKKLPDLASGLGKAIRQFRKATRDLTDQQRLRNLLQLLAHGGGAIERNLVGGWRGHRTSSVNNPG